MKFTVEIDTSNSDFHSDVCDESSHCVKTAGTCERAAANEVRRLLNSVSIHLNRHSGTGGGRIRIMDSNGNTVGSAGWKGDR